MNLIETMSGEAPSSSGEGVGGGASERQPGDADRPHPAAPRTCCASPSLAAPPLKWRGGIGLALFVSLSNPALAAKKEKPDWSATLPAAPEPAPANGAIFQASAGYAPLHAGTRAARLGDPLTILLIESTTAAKTVSSKTRKDGSIALTPPATGPFSFLSPEALKASGNLSFNGQGNAGQTSSLASTLSVTIAELRPNGTALVRGEKRMLLSQGKEWVRFSGIVRLGDVSVDNTVPSSRVADASIEYSGKGALQRSSKPGWLSQFFSFVNPF